MLHIGVPLKTLFTIIWIPQGFQQVAIHNGWCWWFFFILLLKVWMGFPPTLIVTSQLFTTTLFVIIKLWNFMKPAPHSNPNQILNQAVGKSKADVYFSDTWMKYWNYAPDFMKVIQISQKNCDMYSRNTKVINRGNKL